MSWFECLRFLRGLCCAVLQIYTPHRTVHHIPFAGPSSSNLSTMTSTYVLIITSPRAHCSRGSTSSVRVQRVGCTTGICNSNEGCGGDDARASGPAAPVPAAPAAPAAGAAAGSGGSSRGGGRVAGAARADPAPDPAPARAQSDD